MLELRPARNADATLFERGSRCVACGGDRFTALRILADLGAARCDRCRLLIATFDPVDGDGAGYDRIDAEAYERSIVVSRTIEARKLLELVDALPPRGKRWLDVGCGAGVQLAAAQGRGYAVRGVEPDAIAREMAGKRIGAANVAATIEEVEPGEFDVISYLDVLEHVPVADVGATARRAHRLLRDGGHWVIKVPSTDGLFFRLAHAVARLAKPHVVRAVIRRLWLRDHPSPHELYFNQENLVLFLRAHGFAPVVVTYFPTIPSGTVFARLRLDGGISPLEAVATVPPILALSSLERLFGKTDSLVVIARKEASSSASAIDG